MRALAVLFALTLGCGGARTVPPRPAVAPIDAREAAGFASATNALGLDVWAQLRPTTGDANLALSPASIATALAMTYAGAEGDTATAMASVLHVASDRDATASAAGSLVREWNDPARTDYELAVANRLFGAEGYAFAEPFLTLTRDGFGAELERLDFVGATEASRERINGWVEDHTHDRIVDLLPPGAVDPSTQLVLVNAVYFHGRWAVPFDADATRDATFRTPGGDRSVPTMHAWGGRFAHGDGVSILELRYVGEDLSMLFVLPDDPNGLAAVEDGVDPDHVATWAAAVREEHELEIALPRFRIETASISLKAALQALGMAIAFGGAADFGAMAASGDSDLFIDDVLHRVFVEVNEEGTEAAAATAVVMSDEAAMDAPPRFIADHPFLFFLRDLRTGAILFAGRVVDPA